MGKLDGKVALVTGGAFGNGRAMAVRFAQDGAAVKGGVKQLVKSFAVACGRYGITCNAIGPGFIATGMTQFITENPMFANMLTDRTPMGRIGDPADVASVAAFLAADESSFVTGTILFPDGGITAGMYSAASAQMLEQLRRQV